MQAEAVRQELVNTISTNGRVEPENNYEFYSPIATTVKAVYVQPGDQVPARQAAAGAGRCAGARPAGHRRERRKGSPGSAGCGHP